MGEHSAPRTDELLQQIESLCGTLVLADAKDLQALAMLHEGTLAIASEFAGKDAPVLSAVARAAADLIEKVILSEVDDPNGALDIIGKGYAALQTIVRDGRELSEVHVPPELLDQSAATHAPQTPASVESAPSPPVVAPAQTQLSPEPHAAGGYKSVEQSIDADTDLLREFVVEAREHLDNADQHLLTLETEPRDSDAMNAIFRAFHTIKGVAGFLNVADIQALAHESENLLDKARKGELELSGPYIDITFEAIDFMKRLIGHVSNALASGSTLPAEHELTPLIARLRSATSGSPPPETQREFADPKRPLGDALVANGLARSAAVEAALSVQFAHDHPDRLGELLVQHSLISRRQLEDALEAQQSIAKGRPIGEILVEMGALRQEELDRVASIQSTEDDAPRIGELLVKSGEVEAKDVALALRNQRSKPGVAETKEPVKVDADRLDRLIDLVGELVIAESMVAQSPELMAHASAQLGKQVNQLDKITRELQEIGTSLRMVPLRATFQKMARLVRDLSKKSGKRIEFLTDGEDTELDKTVVDKIGDPLVHMVRNACDHGLESSVEERRAAGKPEVGKVVLRAFHKGGSIYVEIQDDGKGLDREAIIAKALERGLIRESDSLTDKEVWNLIFEAGFSTAKSVTDVSGRGVGMDVVRKNIEGLRGQVEIQSVVGKGSTFSIRLPLTLAIIDGMIVRVGRERYIVPTLSVVRSIKPEADQLTYVVGKAEMLSLADGLIPVFRMHRIFAIRDAERDPTKALVVIVEDDGKMAGLMIDELLGQQQIVIKSLGESMSNIPGVAGGAIMSDGTVGLILDVGGLVSLATSDTVGPDDSFVRGNGESPAATPLEVGATN